MLPMWIETTAYRENAKYCEYHQDSGHTTMECRNLTRVIGQIKAPIEGHCPTPAPRSIGIPTGDRTPKTGSDEPEVEDNTLS